MLHQDEEGQVKKSEAWQNRTRVSGCISTENVFVSSHRNVGKLYFLYFSTIWI